VDLRGDVRRGGYLRDRPPERRRRSSSRSGGAHRGGGPPLNMTDLASEEALIRGMAVLRDLRARASPSRRRSSATRTASLGAPAGPPRLRHPLVRQLHQRDALARPSPSHRFAWESPDGSSSSRGADSTTTRPTTAAGDEPRGGGEEDAGHPARPRREGLPARHPPPPGLRLVLRQLAAVHGAVRHRPRMERQVGQPAPAHRHPLRVVPGARGAGGGEARAAARGVADWWRTGNGSAPMEVSLVREAQERLGARRPSPACPAAASRARADVRCGCAMAGRRRSCSTSTPSARLRASRTRSASREAPVGFKRAHAFDAFSAAARLEGRCRRHRRARGDGRLSRGAAPQSRVLGGAASRPRCASRCPSCRGRTSGSSMQRAAPRCPSRCWRAS